VNRPLARMTNLANGARQVQGHPLRTSPELGKRSCPQANARSSLSTQSGCSQPRIRSQTAGVQSLVPEPQGVNIPIGLAQPAWASTNLAGHARGAMGFGLLSGSIDVAASNTIDAGTVPSSCR
jgi:hypothetical protein